MVGWDRFFRWPRPVSYHRPGPLLYMSSKRKSTVRTANLPCPSSITSTQTLVNLDRLCRRFGGCTFNPVEDKREPTPEPGDAELDQAVESWLRAGASEGFHRTPEQALGDRVRELRLARGLSQEALAQLMSAAGHSWHQTTAAKTEASARPIRVNEVVDLAHIFRVDPSDLLSSSHFTDPGLHRLPTVDQLLARLQLDRAKQRTEQLRARRHELESELSAAKAHMAAVQANVTKLHNEIDEVTEQINQASSEEIDAEYSLEKANLAVRRANRGD